MKFMMPPILKGIDPRHTILPLEVLVDSTLKENYIVIDADGKIYEPRDEIAQRIEKHWPALEEAAKATGLDPATQFFSKGYGLSHVRDLNFVAHGQFIDDAWETGLEISTQPMSFKQRMAVLPGARPYSLFGFDAMPKALTGGVNLIMTDDVMPLQLRGEFALKYVNSLDGTKNPVYHQPAGFYNVNPTEEFPKGKTVSQVIRAHIVRRELGLMDKRQDEVDELIEKVVHNAIVYNPNLDEVYICSTVELNKSWKEIVMMQPEAKRFDYDKAHKMISAKPEKLEKFLRRPRVPLMAYTRANIAFHLQEEAGILVEETYRSAPPLGYNLYLRDAEWRYN